MNKRIFLLIDYRNQFYFSTKYRGACVDINKLTDYFDKQGYQVIIKSFSQIDFRIENYEDEWVFYQSSEDPGLLYKDYIEDILLALEFQGAKLIPSFYSFRAHHNKIFMELLRDILNINEINNIISHSFGTYEEYLQSKFPTSSENYVLKPGAGTRSYNVKLLDTYRNKHQLPRKLSKSFTFFNLKLLISRIKTGKPYTPISNNRHKFIIQNYIPNLNGDYRILCYGRKFYVVYRENRKNDFRASGSKKIFFDVKLPEMLLDFAENIYLKFKVPFMSMDIGFSKGSFYLFEFQLLCLGQYTLEKSQFYYCKDGELWVKIYETPDLEREIVSSVIKYIGKY